MDSADSSQDGFLDVEEFLRLMIAEKKVILIHAFKSVDALGRGWVTEAEGQLALAESGFDGIDDLATKAKQCVDSEGKLHYYQFIMNL